MGALNRSAGTNWVEQSGGLPAYIEKIAKSLHEKRGFTISRAIATAVSMCKRWAAGGEDVNPDTRAKAAAALAEWEAKRAAARGRAVDMSHTDALVALDLAAIDDELAVLDLAFGDHKAPYDYKHGFIPISPEAKARKKKHQREAPPEQLSRDDLEAEAARLINEHHATPGGTSRPESPRLAAVQAERKRRIGEAERNNAADRTATANAPADAFKDMPDSTLKMNLASWKAKNDPRYALAVKEAKRRRLDLDLSAAEVDEVLDLAYGDHRPPYDWKHGYIPVSPQAARIKAKKEAAPRGSRGGSSAPSGGSVGRGVKRAAAAKKAAAPKRKPSVAGSQRPQASAQARDAVQRGRATEAERQQVAAADVPRKSILPEPRAPRPVSDYEREQQAKRDKVAAEVAERGRIRRGEQEPKRKPSAPSSTPTIAAVSSTDVVPSRVGKSPVRRPDAPAASPADEARAAIRAARTPGLNINEQAEATRKARAAAKRAGLDFDQVDEQERAKLYERRNGQFQLREDATEVRKQAAANHRRQAAELRKQGREQDAKYQEAQAAQYDDIDPAGLGSSARDRQDEARARAPKTVKDMTNAELFTAINRAGAVDGSAATPGQKARLAALINERHARAEDGRLPNLKGKTRPVVADELGERRAARNNATPVPGDQGSTAMSGKSRPAPVSDDEKARAKERADKITADTLRGTSDASLERNIDRYEASPGAATSDTLKTLRAERERRKAEPGGYRPHSATGATRTAGGQSVRDMDDDQLAKLSRSQQVTPAERRAAQVERAHRTPPAQRTKRQRELADGDGQAEYSRGQAQRRDTTPPADLTDTQLDTARAQSQVGTPRRDVLDAEVKRRADGKRSTDPFNLPGINVLSDGVVTGDDSRLAKLVADGHVVRDPDAKPRPYRITPKGRALYKPSDADRQQSRQVEEGRARAALADNDRQRADLDKREAAGKAAVARADAAREANNDPAELRAAAADLRAQNRNVYADQLERRAQVLEGTRQVDPEPAALTPAVVSRMSDKQLERALDRLAEAGDFSSPAFKAVEAEQNKRDDARNAPSGPSTANPFAGMGKVGSNGEVQVDRGVVRYRQDSDGKWTAYRTGNQQSPVTDSAQVAALNKEAARVRGRAEGNRPRR